MLPLDVFRILTVVITCIGLYSWVYWMLRHKKVWLFAVAPITFFIHLLVFYLVVILIGLPNITVNYWSSGLRLHAVITFFLIGANLITIERRT